VKKKKNSREFSRNENLAGLWFKEYKRPSYDRPKLTLISREKKHLRRCWNRRYDHNFQKPAFGQAKHGQNDPAATVCQQGICCPICEHHFTCWTHPDISLRFRGGGRRVKNFRFSRNSIAARDFFLPACCGLNFDATDLPNSSFEPLYPKLFRGTPEVDLVSTVWPPDLPKVR